jgi:hypothetical protein
LEETASVSASSGDAVAGFVSGRGFAREVARLLVRAAVPRFDLDWAETERKPEGAGKKRPLNKITISRGERNLRGRWYNMIQFLP